MSFTDKKLRALPNPYPTLLKRKGATSLAYLGGGQGHLLLGPDEQPLGGVNEFSA
jgi:hypothetical protein